MTYALLSPPQNFLAARPDSRGRTFSRFFCELKMSSVPKLKDRRVQARCNAIIHAKHMRKIGYTLEAEGFAVANPYNSPSRFEDFHCSLEPIIHIWWDFGRCPIPINFDASKIGNTLIDTVRRIRKSGPIYFRGYGNVGKWFPKMGEETLRSLLESKFSLIGFQMINDFGPHVLDENLMMADLLHFVPRARLASHLVVIDPTSSTARALDELRLLGHEIIDVRPGQDAAEGVWQWEPLIGGVSGRLSAAGPGKITVSENTEHDELNGGSVVGDGRLDGISNQSNDAKKGLPHWLRPVPLTLRGDKFVNVWWDVRVCPLPSNFDSKQSARILIKALNRININGPIFLRVYGFIREMGEALARFICFICESGFQLVGFQLKDYDVYYSRLMAKDCQEYSWVHKPPGIHLFISDVNGSTHVNADVNVVRDGGYEVICVHPESQATDGALGWVSLLNLGLAGLEVSPLPDS